MPGIRFLTTLAYNSNQKKMWKWKKSSLCPSQDFELYLCEIFSSELAQRVGMITSQTDKQQSYFRIYNFYSRWPKDVQWLEQCKIKRNFKWQNFSNIIFNMFSKHYRFSVFIIIFTYFESRFVPIYHIPKTILDQLLIVDRILKSNVRPLRF